MASEELLIKINGNAKSIIDELNKTKAKTADLEKSLTKVAKVSAAAFAAFAGVIGATTVAFGKFESKFTNVVTLLDKSSFKTKDFNKGIEDLKKGVLDLGAKTGEGFDTLNQGLFDLISSGRSAEGAVDDLRVATDLAAAGATDVATAVKALTASFTAFGDEAGSAEAIAQKFFTAQKFGVTTVGELATEFNKVAGLAKTLKLSFDETLAASTALTANGAKPTAQAFTEMKAVLNAVVLAQSKLAKESPAVQQALSLQNIENVGLVEALRQTKAALGDDVVAMQRVLGSAEALSAALSLTGQQGELFTKITKEMADEAKRAAAFDEALKTKKETLEKATNKAKRALEAMAIQIGEALAPTVNKLAEIISAMAQKFNSLDKQTVENIASLIKWGAIISGTIATLTTGVLIFLKVKAALVALAAGLAILKTATLAFAGSLAFLLSPITLVVGAIAALGAGVAWLYNKFKEKPETKGLDEVNKKLEELKKKREEVNKEGVKGFKSFFTNKDKELAKIDDEIAKQEALKKKIEETNAAKNAGGKKKAAEEEAAKKEAVAPETSPEIEARKKEAEEAARIEEEKQAKLRELKALAAEEEKVRLEEEAAAKRELEAILREEDLALKEEQRAEDQERKAVLNAEDLKDLQGQIKSERQIEKDVAKERVQEKIKAREQEIKDRIKYGQAVATINKYLNSSEIQGVKDTSAQLAQLTNSKNATLKAIGKRAAQANIAISTAEGAIKAYSSLSGIPLVGPALGAAAAAALVAYGAERISEVNRAARGGYVPNTGGGSRDRVPMLLEPDELVVPKNLAPDFIQSVGRPDTQAVPEEGEASNVIMIGIEDEAEGFLTARQREAQALGIGGV